MGELVRDVLTSSGNCETLDATKACITKILRHTERFQERVRKHFDDNYVDFMPNHTASDMYLEEGEALIRETDEVLRSVGGDTNGMLQEASTELAACISELNEVSLGLRVSQRILKIDDLFQCVEEANATKEYLVVLDLIGKLKVIIYAEGDEKDADVDCILQKCECYETIKVKYQIQSHILQQNLQQRFDQLVQLNCKPFPTSKCVTLQISKDESQLQDTVMALFQARYNPQKMCEFLLENCLEPLILKPVSVEYNDTDNSEYVIMTLSYSLKELSRNHALRPSYSQVFENIKKLLTCLANINVSVTTTQHVFSIIGDLIKTRFLKLLIDECLMHAIPETMDEYQTSTLVEDVHQFEQLLADTFLINLEKDRALTEFRELYETYSRNKLFKRVLDNAKEIMSKDLQDMVLVMERNTSEDVANNPFLFPRCMVSKSTSEIIKLMDLILRQPQEQHGDGEPENSLTGVVSMILEAYMVEVPKVHKTLLESIPQQSVLFYNNCMYLGYWLARNSDKNIAESPALVRSLQATGTKYYKVQVDYQQQIIIDILNEFDLSDPHTLGTAPLKLVRQCLRQLELLKNVWLNVLPETEYNKTFNELLNVFCSEIIRRIISLEDISATVANELSDLIDVVLKKAPTLFKEKHEVIHIKSWTKLEHLKMILNASLKEITENWCEGAGILTANFKAEEVKHLIRALFQNTDRRAKALSQIV